MTEPGPGTPPRRALPDSEPLARPSAPTDGSDWLRQLDWRQFEQLVADAYRQQGYTAMPTASGADGGVDLVLVRGAERLFVQCKHWNVYQVGAPVVRELFGLVVANRATGGIVVTSGSFTREAVAFGAQSGVVLLDGPAVLQLLASGPVAAPVTSPQPIVQEAQPAPSQGTPPCPLCLAPTRLRQARRGAHAGSWFWGCTRYPGCKGMIEAPQVMTSPVPARAGRLGARLLRLVLVSLALFVAFILFFALLTSLARSLGPSNVARSLVPSSAASASPEIGEQPMDVVLDAKAERLYVANFVGGDVSVLAADTLTVVGRIDVPGQPVALAHDAKTQRLYVADRPGRKVYAIDLRNGDTVAELNAGKDPVDLAIDTRHHRLFVASSGDDESLLAYDTRTNKRVGSYPSGHFAALATDPAAGLLYALDEWGQVAVLKATTLKRKDTLALRPGRGMTIDTKRQRLYVLHDYGIREENLLTGATRTIEVEKDGGAICADASKRIAYVAYPDSDRLVSVSLG